MPDAARAYLNGMDFTAKLESGAPAVEIHTVGKDAAAALASGWSGKPKITGSPYDPLAGRVGSEVVSLTLVPPSTGPSDVSLFLLGGTPVPVTPGTPLGAAESAALERSAVILDSAAIVGDAARYADLLRAALDSPLAPIITKS